MKVLVISDLHLCDTRNSPDFEARRLEKLAEFIRACAPDAVLNLGDTVSRRAFLRPEFPSEAEGFRGYLAWRSKFDIPFAECGITRELDFFSSLFGVEPDNVTDLSPDSTIITLLPREGAGHRLFPEQLAFLESALERCRREGKSVVIGTHVPYPGSCSRQPGPGIFLEIPPELHETLIAFPSPVWWCGGHFHWAHEAPSVIGSLTVCIGARFRFEARNDTTYLRVLDTASGKTETFFPDL
ncbi:MAG: metallophosphoesterase [Lentisphaeria bacterium]|nr:metallophosphoesterase [Lentisphaeria bacterium]